MEFSSTATYANRYDLDEINVFLEGDSNNSIYFNFEGLNTDVLLLSYEANKSTNYFVGSRNFIAITKYNVSHFYAKAVYDLAQEFL